MTISARLIARSTRVMMSSTMHSWAPTQTRRITAGSGMQWSGRSPSSISSGSRPADISRSFRHSSSGGILERLRVELAIRGDRRSFRPSHAPGLSRAPLCAERDQSEVAASGILSRCRPERLQRPLCDLPSARATSYGPGADDQGKRISRIGGHSVCHAVAAAR
jgi:hypothetical protein